MSDHFCSLVSVVVVNFVSCFNCLKVVKRNCIHQGDRVSSWRVLVTRLCDSQYATVFENKHPVQTQSIIKLASYFT